MSLGVRETLEGGYERTVAPSGLQFVAIWVVLSVLSGIVTVDLLPAVYETVPVGLDPAAARAGPAPSLGLSAGMAGALWLLLALVGVVVRIAALRTFVNGTTQQLPRTYFTRNIAWVWVNLVAGTVVFWLAVGVGLLLLVVPGLFVLVSLFLWEVFVAVKDESFVQGLRSSWDLTSGHRRQLFVLGVKLFVLGVILSVGLGVLFFLGGAIIGILNFALPDVVNFLLNQVGTALLTVFSLAVIAEVYTQLAGDDAKAQL